MSKDTQKEVREETQNRGLKFKQLKLMSYEEALKASKKFIYDITKAVMQKFSPSDRNDVLTQGRKLFKSGAKYLHTVDIMGLSMQRQVSTAKGQPQKQDIGQNR
jgi:hypothetical protein